MNMQIVAQNGATITIPDDGYRPTPAVSAFLARHTLSEWDDLPGSDGLHCLCAFGRTGRLFAMDMVGVVRHFAELRCAGRELVIPPEELIAHFVIPIAG
jgi:hypothetical protein